MNEIELKFLVPDADALRRVGEAAARRGARVHPPERQVNHFFDTPAGELRAAGRAIRLREQSGAFVLATKGPTRARGALNVRRELEVRLDPPDAAAVLDGRVPPLAALLGHFPDEPFVRELAALVGDRPLVHVGTFCNDRAKAGPLAVAGHALHLELDRTEFPGDVIHHEVELELPAGCEREAETLLRELFREADVRATPAPGKASRFFRALAGERI